MKTLLTVVLIAFLSLPTAMKAQDCKYDIKQKDKFTGKSKVGYWYQLGTDMITLYKVDTTTLMEVTSTSKGAMQQGVQKGSIGQFRLANGEFVTFTAIENAEPVVKVNGAQTDYNSTIKAVYSITAADLAKMGANAPLAMKVLMGSKEVVKEFGDKKSEKIKVAAKCLSDYKE